MMRVLIAYDGSDGAEQAVVLASSLQWRGDTTLRVVGVAEQAAMAPIMAPGQPGGSPALESQIVSHLEEVMAGAVDRLRSASGANVAGEILRGRPASVLVDEAIRFRADLVVGGSRGHGTVASLVLGSVSAEFVDHAPCPALVARTPTVTRILFASDGSAPAAVAEDTLARWPIFERVPIEVVSVAHVVEPWHTGIAPTMHRAVIAAHAKDLESARAAHTEVAEAAAKRLRAAGRTAEARVRTGDAAGEIIAAANESSCDLIVMGSRGHTGLVRMLIGSVARNVLHASAASVMVVREPTVASDTAG
jgi:nucleotide-binding universal stress UspA family protein